MASSSVNVHNHKSLYAYVIKIKLEMMYGTSFDVTFWYNQEKLNSTIRLKFMNSAGQPVTLDIECDVDQPDAIPANFITPEDHARIALMR
jgi:hypothetical protein